MAKTRLATVPVMVYAGLFVCASGLYNIFERQILEGATDIDDRGRRLARFRALLALVLFGSAVLGALIRPWIGFTLVCAGLVLHLQPDVRSIPFSRRVSPRTPIETH